jgi:uncharacterized protein YndB with AHSA1/START domain
MEINQKAPVTYSAQIVIQAPINQVYDLLADINNWPQWRSDVQQSHLEGSAEVGSTFRWKSGTTMLTSRLETVEPNKTFVWTGKAMGIQVIHAWHLSTDGKTTTVKTEESMEGVLVSLLHPVIRKVLVKALHTALDDIKQAAEAK